MTVEEFNEKYNVGEKFYHVVKKLNMGTISTRSAAYLNCDGEVVVKTNTHVFPVLVKNLQKEKP